MITSLRRNPTATAWGLVAAMAAAGSLLVLPTLDWPPTRDAPIVLPWIVLVVIFAAAESITIHLPSRDGAHTLAISEVGVVAGLTTTTPWLFVTARLVGGLIAYGLVRRLAPVKTAFNVSHNLLGSGIAVWIVHAVGSIGGIAWPIIVGATALDGVAGSTMVGIVVSIMNPNRTVRETLTEIRSSFLESISVASIATIAYLLLASSVGNLPLAVLMLFGLVSMVRMYGRLHRRTEEIEAVYAFTQEAGRSNSIHELAATVLQALSARLSCGRAVMVVRDGLDAWTRFDLNGNAVSSSPVHASEAAMIVELALQDTDDHVGAEIAMGSESIGALMASARTIQGTHGFSSEDRSLMKTLGANAGWIIRQYQVQQLLELENQEKERIIRSKDQLIAAVSHELRTPLTGILGFAELLRDDATGEVGPHAQEMVASIASESLDLANIVEDLITVAKYDLGSLAVRCQPTDIAGLVSSTIDNLKGRMKAEGEIEDARGWVDGPRLRQVIRNLISNAHRYGGERTVVRCYEVSNATLVEVCDNGQGIGREHRDRVFDPYVSAHAPGTQPGSVGLGLTISRQLMRMMGGDITYHRRDGWTVFQVEMQRTEGTASSTTNSGLLAG